MPRPSSDGASNGLRQSADDNATESGNSSGNNSASSSRNVSPSPTTASPENAYPRGSKHIAAESTTYNLDQANKIIGGRKCHNWRECRRTGRLAPMSTNSTVMSSDIDARMDDEMHNQDQKKMFSFSLPFGSALDGKEIPGARHVKRALKQLTICEHDSNTSRTIDVQSETTLVSTSSTEQDQDSGSRHRKSSSVSSSKHSIPIPDQLRFFERKKEAEQAELAALEPTLSREDVPFVTVKQLSTGRSKTVTESIKRNLTVNSKKLELPRIDGDVVVLGGYRGSILRDTKTGRRQWIPFKVGLNMRKVDLTVGPNDEDELNMEDTIYPDGMLTHVGPVDLSRQLMRKLAEYEKCTVHDFGYDWRLSPDISSKKLLEFIRKIVKKQKASGKKRGVFVIAHSMGGLVTHHALNTAPELFRGVVYCGSPSSCVNVLGPIRFGDDVLFSSRVLTPKVNFLMRSSFVFLPLDGKCFVNEKDPTKRYDLDYYDPKVWVEYNLSPYVSQDALAQYRAQKKNGKKVEPVTSSPVSKRSSEDKINAFQTIRHQATDISDKIITRSTVLLKESSDMLRTSTTTIFQPLNDTILFPLNDKKEDPLPFDVAYEYLARTLKRTKKFRDELLPRPGVNYPPLACIYGESVPTVRAAKVAGPHEIKNGVYDHLLFGAGDGVVYRKHLMPEGVGFPVVAKVQSDRDHVTLLNDIEGVGQCLQALLDAERDPQILADKVKSVKEREQSVEKSEEILDDRRQAEAEDMEWDHEDAVTLADYYDSEVILA